MKINKIVIKSVMSPIEIPSSIKDWDKEGLIKIKKSVNFEIIFAFIAEVLINYISVLML